MTQFASHNLPSGFQDECKIVNGRQVTRVNQLTLKNTCSLYGYIPPPLPRPYQINPLKPCPTGSKFYKLRTGPYVYNNNAR